MPNTSKIKLLQEIEDIRHPTYIRFSEAQMQKMEDMYVVDKKSCKTIGDVFGIDRNTVHRRLVERGVTIRQARKVNAIPDERFLEIVEFRKQGYSWEVIGEKIGVHHSTAWRWFKHQLSKLREVVAD